jgi:hypothetical protein
MNLCEKSEVPFNEYGRFCSPRKTMFFAGGEKEIFNRGDAEARRGRAG